MTSGEKLSRTQLMALLWAGLLAPAAELLPGVTLGAGRGAWLSTVAALPVFLLGGWLLGRVSEGQGLAAGLRRCLGRAAGTGAVFLYIMWGLVLLALRLRLCAQRLLEAGQRDGSLWFFVLAVAAAAVWMAWGKPAALARTGQVLLAALLAASAVVLGLALFRVRPENLFPLWTGDVVPVVRSALPACGVLSYGLFTAFLLGQTRWEKGEGGAFLWWGTVGCLLLSLGQLVILGRFGAVLTAQLDSPFFSLAKSVGVEGAFQRVESVVAALWVFADLILCAVLLMALRQCCAAVAPGAGGGKTALFFGVLAAAAALLAFPNVAAVHWFSRGWALWGTLFFSLPLPAAALAMERVCRKRQ